LISSNSDLLAMLSVTANVVSSSATTGTLTWNFNSSTEPFNYLKSGETLTLTYTVRVTDSNTPAATAERTVVVNIAGTNDTPIVYTGFSGLNPTHTAYRGSQVLVFGTSGRALSLGTVETGQKFNQVVLTVSKSPTVLPRSWSLPEPRSPLLLATPTSQVARL